jgi:molybdopterin-containing oxidoreductase family membrane subunit
MIPDLAVVRDRATGMRSTIYGLLAMGWRGTAREWRVYRHASTLMAALIIPVAVSVHSIVSWDFAMALVPGWHSTIFAPYFVIGAIFSGVAAVVMLILILRKVFRLEAFLTANHLDNMGKVLLAVSLLWSYFYFAEVLTTWYGHKPAEWEVFIHTADKYGILLGIMVLGNTCITIPSLCFRRVRRSGAAMLLIAIFVNIGMFIERILIIIPPTAHKNVPFLWGTYRPTWVELSIMAGAFAGFSLMYVLFSRFMPIVAISDVHEGEAITSTRKLGRRTVTDLMETE